MQRLLITNFNANIANIDKCDEISLLSSKTLQYANQCVSVTILPSSSSSSIQLIPLGVRACVRSFVRIRLKWKFNWLKIKFVPP